MKDQKNSHFMKCANSLCAGYTIVDVSRTLSSEVVLCQNCKDLKAKSHVVQCLCCGAILDFIPVEPNEKPKVIYVKKCLDCGGTIEDEINIINDTQANFLIS